MKSFHQFGAGLVIMSAISLWGQTDNSTQVPANAQAQNAVSSGGDDTSSSVSRMSTPPPVSGQTYPVEFSSEERSNYLRGGVFFTGAYSDNAVGEVVNGHPVSDESYSVAPTLALDSTTARQHLLLDYAPGYTFYQHTSARNEADQNVAIEYEYRLSPHVTFSARDSFLKSSNIFNQPNLAESSTVTGGADGANFSVIAPVADRLSNLGTVGLTYQFSMNQMLGASGSFSNLHYPDQAQVPGLFDSSTQSGLAFYSHRVAEKNYFGIIYDYQRLLSYPTTGLNETQTHAGLLFYTAYPVPRLSLSLFGGSQYSDTVPTLPLQPFRAWKPAGGASIGWQGSWNTFAISYLHIIAGGGGLVGAVQLDSATASIGQRITKSLNASVNGGYAQNDILGASALGVANGHSIFGTASLQQQFRQHVGLQLGYTRLHQDYSGVTILSATPNTNREFVCLSYQFSKALGR
jgi:hypothetical protein